MSRPTIPTSSIRRIRPRNDQVLILRDPREQRKGNIILPDVSRQQQQTGTVIAVGPGKIELGVLNEIDLTPGDRVLFQYYSGTDFLTEGDSGEEYVMLAEKDILGVIPE